MSYCSLLIILVIFDSGNQTRFIVNVISCTCVKFETEIFVKSLVKQLKFIYFHNKLLMKTVVMANKPLLLQPWWVNEQGQFLSVLSRNWMGLRVRTDYLLCSLMRPRDWRSSYFNLPLFVFTVYIYSSIHISQEMHGVYSVSCSLSTLIRNNKGSRK